jgi:transposase
VKFDLLGKFKKITRKFARIIANLDNKKSLHRALKITNMVINHHIWSHRLKKIFHVSIGAGNSKLVSQKLPG